MKILFVTPAFPFPPRRGYLLMAYHHIEYLSARHEVDLISFVTSEADVAGGHDLRQCCRRVDLVDLPHWRALAQVALRLPRGEPAQVAYHRSREMADLIDRRLRGEKYDIVVFVLTRMAQYRPDWYRRPTVLNMVDPFVLNYERSLPFRGWRSRLLARSESARLRGYEPRVAPRFDRVLLIAEADVRDYQPVLPGARMDWVPLAIDANEFAPDTSVDREPGLVVLSGNMFHGPNVDAVDVFCRDVFPLVRRAVSNARLCLVGARPAPAVQRWGAHPAIEVTGSVPDVRPYVARAMVSVCPVRLKVGTQTKILEAMAMGTPVVSTTAGNNGIGGVPGKHLHIADTADDFADRVIALLRGEQWHDLSGEGRRFVMANFTWDQSGVRLERILSDAVAERTGPDPPD